MKQSIFVGNIDNNKIILLLYVDDDLIISPSKFAIELFIDKLSKSFNVKYSELNYLGMF